MPRPPALDLPNADLLRLAETNPALLRELLDWSAADEWQGNSEGLARFTLAGVRERLAVRLQLARNRDTRERGDT